MSKWYKCQHCGYLGLFYRTSRWYIHCGKCYGKLRKKSEGMKDFYIHSNGLCRCGHYQNDHIAQEHPKHNLNIPGHGACTKCKCLKFFWVAEKSTPEAKEYIRKKAESNALTAINAIAADFGY